MCLFKLAFLFPSDKYPDVELLYQQSLQSLGKWLFINPAGRLFVDKSISWLRQINFIQITPVREGGEKSGLVCQGYHSRVSQAGWLKQCFSQVLEAGSPRSRCQQVCHLLRPLSLACRWLSSPSFIFTGSSHCEEILISLLLG